MATLVSSPSALRVLRHARLARASPARDQVRHATLIRRPRRPYTFTQLVALSDGSMFLHRTTSPMPIHKSTKDVRNTALWNPSSQKLMNVEEDEAGKLKAFRAKFGRGWDVEAADEDPAAPGSRSDHFMDLISGSGKPEDQRHTQIAKGAKVAASKPGKGKSGKA